MYDPGNPNIRDEGKRAATNFEKAYWQVMGQVEAPAESVRLLLPRLYASYEAGSSTKLPYIGQYLPEGQWRWPEYERQLPRMRKLQYEATKKWLDADNDLKSLASMIGLDAFKKIAGELLGGELPPIRKWEQAHKLCETISLKGHESKALELLRNLALEKHAKKVNEYDDMLQMLVSRIYRLAYGHGRWQQVYEEEIFSYLILFVPDRDKARPQCFAIEGKALHLNNPYWKDNFPPCERLDCRCYISAKAEWKVERDGLEIIDKI